MRGASLDILFLCCLSTIVSGELPMSHLFATWDDLAKSDSVQNVSWTELQKRCQPGVGPHQAQSGWISDSMAIKDVLKKDWETVKVLGTSHIELAAHLDAIWSLANPCDFKNPKNQIDYDPRSLQQNTLDSRSPVHLSLTCLRTRGIQDDLLKDGMFSGWNTEWTLSNGDVKVHIGGRDSRLGLVQYIKLFGFYEGGVNNAYRVDPQGLVAMLSGKKAVLV
jgi:hypothetical protein